MKSIVLLEIMPGDEWGNSWRNWAIINEKQCYFVNHSENWEDGTSSDFYNYPIDDEFYKFVFAKIMDYLENINGDWNTFENLGYCNETYFCYCIHDSEKNKEDIIPDADAKESKIIDFVDDYVLSNEERIDFETMDEKYRDLFHYFSLLTDSNLLFYPADKYYNHVLENISKEDLKNKILKEWEET